MYGWDLSPSDEVTEIDFFPQEPGKALSSYVKLEPQDEVAFEGQMDRFCGSIQQLWAIVRRLFLICAVLEILFLKKVTSQVDTSKALIWSTTTLDGGGSLTIIHGDPEAYITDITLQLNQTNISSYSLTSPNRIGALDTGYRQSIIYIFYRQKICFSTTYIKGNDSELLYLDLVATSDQVTGFALDWVSNLLYWSDAGDQRICMIDARSYAVWRVVVDTDITSPQDVVVYPQQSYLFWSDLGVDPKIERLDMSNDQRMVLLSNGTLKTPTTLAIDFFNLRLFWLDSGRETIGSMKFDGSDVSLWSISLFSSISSFVLYKNYIFFGDNAQSAVYIYNVTGRQNLSTIPASRGQRGIIYMKMWSPERQPSLTNPCTNLNGGCDHFCIRISATSRRCLCAMGFFLDSNGHTCFTKPLSTDRFLLMTDEEQGNTFQIDVETGEVRAITYVDVPPTAMDYDPISKCFFWFDSTNKRINRTALDNSYRGVFQDQFGIEITSLAVDAVSRTLYYADYGAGTIGQISLTTKKNNTLLAQDGSSPRAIVLDIKNRLMYWSDCGLSSTIERGSIKDPTINRQSIVDELFGCATSLAIDFEGQVMYWGYSELARIERAKLDGSSRTTIHLDSTASYSGLALDTRYLYLADSNKRQIQRLDRTTNLISNLTTNLFTKPYALIYYASYPTSTTLDPTSTTSDPASNPTSYPTSATSGVASLTTVISASVVGGAVVLVAVIVTVGIVLSRKSRSTRTQAPFQPGQVCDTLNSAAGIDHYDSIDHIGIQNGASPQVEQRYSNGQTYDNRSHRNEPDSGPYDTRIDSLESMRYMKLLHQDSGMSTIFATRPINSPPPYKPEENQDDYI